MDKDEILIDIVQIEQNVHGRYLLMATNQILT